MPTAINAPAALRNASRRNWRRFDGTTQSAASHLAWMFASFSIMRDLLCAGCAAGGTCAQVHVPSSDTYERAGPLAPRVRHSRGTGSSARTDAVPGARSIPVVVVLSVVVVVLECMQRGGDACPD